MKRTMIVMVVCALTLLGAAGYAIAGDSIGYDVKASIASSTAITAGIIKVVGTVQTPGQQAIDFGQLRLDTATGTFTSDAFYIVDVGVASNATTWSIGHAPTAVNLLGSVITPIPTLSNHINVTFVKVVGTVETAITGGYLGFQSSNFSVNSTTLGTGGHLRIYYGIAGGTGDATGVTAIPSTQAAGNYSGRVTLTLTP